MTEGGESNSSEEFVPSAPGQQPWSRRAQRIASVIWPSFGAAVVATMILLTFFDPELLGVAMMPEREITATTGAGICFFFFWFIGLLSSSTTMFLRRTRRRAHGHDDDNEPRGYQPDEFKEK